MAVVVTVAKGYDLAYIWKTQGETAAGHVTGGYYINAAQAGEPPGRWWGPGARALGFNPGQLVERQPYDASWNRTGLPATGDSPTGRSVTPATGPRSWPMRSPVIPLKAAPCIPGSRWSPAARTDSGCTRR